MDARSSASSLCILVVDDNQICRNITARCFRELGYKAQQAENGAEALGNFSTDIELVVTDIEMPVMNGYQLANKIHEKNPSTPVIAMTSLSAGQLAKQQAQEFIDVVDKPVTKAKCKKILERAGLTKPRPGHDERLLRAV